jgi:hypothetical protein
MGGAVACGRPWSVACLVQVVCLGFTPGNPDGQGLVHARTLVHAVMHMLQACASPIPMSLSSGKPRGLLVALLATCVGVGRPARRTLRLPAGEASRQPRLACNNTVFIVGCSNAGAMRSKHTGKASKGVLWHFAQVRFGGTMR